MASTPHPSSEDTTSAQDKTPGHARVADAEKMRTKMAARCNLIEASEAQAPADAAPEEPRNSVDEEQAARLAEIASLQEASPVRQWHQEQRAKLDKITEDSAVPPSTQSEGEVLSSTDATMSSAEIDNMTPTDASPGMEAALQAVQSDSVVPGDALAGRSLYDFDGGVRGPTYLTLVSGVSLVKFCHPKSTETWAFGAIVVGTPGWFPTTLFAHDVDTTAYGKALDHFDALHAALIF